MAAESDWQNFKVDRTQLEAAFRTDPDRAFQYLLSLTGSECFELLGIDRVICFDEGFA